MRPADMRVSIIPPDLAFREERGEVWGFTPSLSIQSGWGESTTLGPVWTPRPATRQQMGHCYVEISYTAPWPSKHSTFINWIKQILLEKGYDVIQKRAWKDGHMVSDWVNYVRTRKKTGPYSFHVFDGEYEVRDFRKLDASLTSYSPTGSNPFPPSSLGGILIMQWGLDVETKDQIRWGKPCLRG